MHFYQASVFFGFDLCNASYLLCIRCLLPLKPFGFYTYNMLLHVIFSQAGSFPLGMAVSVCQSEIFKKLFCWEILYRQTLSTEDESFWWWWYPGFSVSTAVRLTVVIFERKKKCLNNYWGLKWTLVQAVMVPWNFHFLYQECQFFIFSNNLHWEYFYCVSPDFQLFFSAQVLD